MTDYAENYEDTERVAIDAGKAALLRAKWLRNRAVESTAGSFVELLENDVVHPDYFSAHVVDGVGTKLFLCPWSGNYRLQPVDAVAMNANDMAPLLSIIPDSISLYLACQRGVESDHMAEIMNGFVDAAKRIRIPDAPFDLYLAKVETASLDEIVSLGVPNKGYDVGVVMTGFIEKGKVPQLRPHGGDYIVGVSSTGMHSNGFTGARHVLLFPDSALEPRAKWRKQYEGKFALGDTPEVLEGQTVLEALQTPTALYLVEAALIGRMFDTGEVYGINITGNGLHNFNRVGMGVSFEITDPLEMLPIHRLLAQESGWDPQTAYTKQNMGMGFAYIVPDQDTAEAVVKFINERGENHAQIVGRVHTARKSDEGLRTTMHKPYEGPKLDFVGYNG